MRSSIARGRQGVTTVGSCVVRVDPDHAVIAFAISRLETRADAAIEAMRQASQAVEGAIGQRALAEASWRRGQPELHTHLGNVEVRLRYTLKLDELAQLDDLLAAITTAGANEIQRIDYRSSALRQARAEARQGAVLVALQKARLFAEAAELDLGDIVSLRELEEDEIDTSDLHALDELNPGAMVAPGTVSVAARVRVTWSIQGTGAATGQFPQFPGPSGTS